MTKARKGAVLPGSKLLQKFAQEHDLNRKIEYDECDESLVARKVMVMRFIRVGDYGLITDPSDNPILVDGWGKTRLTRELRDLQVKDPLLLTLFTQNKKRLDERIAFAVRCYENGRGNPNNPNSPNWHTVLDRIGLRYFCGEDNSISFLFPSQDKASVALALALAGSSDDE